MKEGDIIKTYHKGYFVLDRIERRFKTELWESCGLRKDLNVGDEMTPLFHYTQIFDENFNKKTSKKSCDAGFCSLASESIKEELVKIKEKQKKLKEYLKKLENGK